MVGWEDGGNAVRIASGDERTGERHRRARVTADRLGDDVFLRDFGADGAHAFFLPRVRYNEDVLGRHPNTQKLSVCVSMGFAPTIGRRTEFGG